MLRFLLVPLLLALMVIIPFLIWGDQLQAILEVDREAGRFGGTGISAALVGIGLLVADLVLPIPTTSVIAGLGIIYGPIMGTFYGVAGSMLAALTGYGLGRLLGRPLASRWIGSHLDAGEHAFLRYGGWIVAASRWMPVLPEVISVSAGVSRMPLRGFLLAALCGTLPHCAVFAMIGHLGAATPVWTIAISAVIPVVLWFAVQRTGLAGRFGLSERG